MWGIMKKNGEKGFNSYDGGFNAHGEEACVGGLQWAQVVKGA